MNVAISLHLCLCKLSKCLLVHDKNKDIYFQTAIILYWTRYQYNGLSKIIDQWPDQLTAHRNSDSYIKEYYLNAFMWLLTGVLKLVSQHWIV